jgi:molecular chaperone DnaK
VLVYDLGGGTFDATVLAMRGSDCRVLAAAGDNALGGADFDTLLLDRAVEAFEKELGPRAVRKDPMLLQQLSDLVERAKMELSVRESATVVLPFAGVARGAHPSWKIDRAEFESLISPYIERSIILSRKALAEAGVGEREVDHLVLSGGSSRIPLVRRSLASIIGREAEGLVNPDEIVAFGAAVFAGIQKGGSDDFTVRDAVSRSFGVEIDGNDFVTLITKNTPIPVSRSRAFTTVADDQRSVEIHVLQGESSHASENLSLGRFLLSGIRSGKRGEPRIEVEFSIDPDEILHVRARDLDTGVSQAVTIAASPEGSSAVSAERLRSLAMRALSLSRYAAGDRALEAELETAIGDAEKMASSLERGGGGGIPLNAAATAEATAAATAAMSLEAIVAELEARQSAGG